MFEEKVGHMEKKQLLLISKNEDLIKGLKTAVNFSLEVTSVKSIHAGYTLALSYLPEAILIDYQSLGLESNKHVERFKESHFLNKSSFFLLISASKIGAIGKNMGNVDHLLMDSLSYQEIAETVEEELIRKSCISNYWKDSFLGLFNLLSQPVILLQNETIVAVNDSFKKHFFIDNPVDVDLPEILDCRSKGKVLQTLRNFLRGKHMKASTTTSLMVTKDKLREGKITFSKLDRSITGQLIMMIDFNPSRSLIQEEIGSVSKETEEYFENNNSLKSFSFTKREKEIIELLCKGYKTKEISDALCISVKTIEKHRANIIRRTNSDTILESVVYALNHKLIDI